MAARREPVLPSAVLPASAPPFVVGTLDLPPVAVGLDGVLAGCATLHLAPENLGHLALPAAPRAVSPGSSSFGEPPPAEATLTGSSLSSSGGGLIADTPAWSPTACPGILDAWRC